MDLNQPHLKNTQTFLHIKRYLISYIFYCPDSKDDTALTGVCNDNSKNELNHPKGPHNSFNSSLITQLNFLLREWKTEFFLLMRWTRKWHFGTVLLFSLALFWNAWLKNRKLARFCINLYLQLSEIGTDTELSPRLTSLWLVVTSCYTCSLNRRSFWIQ